MITVSAAIRIIQREASELGRERLSLNDALGRVLAEDVVADTDLPPFDRSQMDGYAVKAADTENVPTVLKIVGESAAGGGWNNRVKRGEAVRIMTGAPVPKGADAVQKIELTTEEGDSVVIAEPTIKGRFIVKRGEEVRKGKIVLTKGVTLTSSNISLPAAFGFAKILVARRPRVAIISTGSEIVGINRKPKHDQIRNSNSLMLASLCRDVGADPQILPIVRDKLSDLKSQILDAVKSADVLISTGGVSVGRYDLTKPALLELGAHIFFDRVALKPGKPTVFAKLNKTFVFGLPGNPVSAAVTFHLLVRRLIGRMQGTLIPCLRGGRAIIGERAKGTIERDTYKPAALSTNLEGRLIATPTKWLGSSDFVGFASADALIEVPMGTDIEKGEAARILYLH